MPAINVERTDTFEQQRLKINQIGDRLFNVTGGGTDLSTGNLKLGDGAVLTPSLSFENDQSLGIYRPTNLSMGFVSNGKKLVDFSNESTSHYKNFNITRTSIQPGAVTVTNPGSGYTAGVYYSVELIGGTGSGAFADVEVKPFLGTVTNTGADYGFGSFIDVPLDTNGSGTGAKAVFTIDRLLGEITDGGSGYAADSSSLNVALTTVTGSGSGARADIATNANGEISSIAILSDQQGSGYQRGDILTTTALGGSGVEFIISTDPGIVKDFEINDFGSGYQTGDTLTFFGSLSGLSGNIAVSENLVTGLSAATIAQIVPGSTVTVTGGTATIEQEFLEVAAVDYDNNAINLTNFASVGGTLVFDLTPEYLQFGAPSANFEYTVGNLGAVSSVVPDSNNGGSGYISGDSVSVDPADLIPTNEIAVTVSGAIKLQLTGSNSASNFNVGDELFVGVGGTPQGDPQPILKVIDDGSGGLDYLLVVDGALIEGDQVINSTTPGTYTAGPVGPLTDFYFLDTGDGNGAQLSPDLTLYAGSTYTFDFSDASNGQNRFALSRFRDGYFAPSLIEDKLVTLDVTSRDIVVNDATNIEPGMAVTLSGLNTGPGRLLDNTLVESISGTTITLTKNPVIDGSALLNFTGVEYTERVTRTDTSITIQVTDSTPSTLRYFSLDIDNLAGEDGDEPTVTVDPNNPQVFGTGLAILVAETADTNVIGNSVSDGKITSLELDTGTATIGNGTFTYSATTPLLNGITASFTTINANESDEISVNSGSTTFSGNVGVSTTLSIEASSGDLETSGTVKGSVFNSNNILLIEDNLIYTAPGNQLVIAPAATKTAKIDGSTALVLPTGTTAERPIGANKESGAIRFNTETSQYEGYSATTDAWASLGGVRDQDGNTFIIAEETVGANDNTLWFYNDDVNTMRFTPQYQEFINVKKLRSLNVTAPAYSEWTANTPVNLGDYLKYQNYIYEVTAVTNPGGTNFTATSGNEPVHDSGSLVNGDVTLTFSTVAVAPVTFEEISEVRIDPNGFTNLVINNELRFNQNVFSSDVRDIIIRPSGTQKVVIDTTSSLVVPVGDNNNKGNPLQGSIRYNTADTTFEGFDGVQWGSLGGVKDTDGDTLIKAESAAGQDEDTLFFQNNGVNTLTITETTLSFNLLDTINSPTSNTLNINAETLTFDSLATTLDNSDTTRTFLFSTRDNFDIGMSSGLQTEPVLRFTNEGDIFYNLGYGTGTYSGVTLFDNELKLFELADYKIITKKIDLEKGTFDNGDAVIYDPQIEECAKIQVVAHNISTGDKEFIEYSVINKGLTDIFYTEIGNVVSGQTLFSSEFDFNDSNRVRLSFTLDAGLTAGDDVEITVISTIIKR